MGLLGDYLPSLPADPNQNSAARQGLLQFGAALLGGRGNFGSIMGQGLAAGAGGYNNALQALQQKALADAQTRHLNAETGKYEAAAALPGKIQSILGGAPGAGAGPSASLGLVSASPSLSSLPQMSAAPDAGRPLSMIPQASMAPQAVEAPAAAPQAAQGDEYQFYKSRGDLLAANGLMDAAKVQYEMAEKARPKVKEILTLTQNGKRVKVQTFDDGRKPQVLEGFDPDLEKLSFHDAGGTIEGLDPFTGLPKSSAKKTVSPDSVYNRGTQYGVEDKRAERAKADEQAPLTADAILNAAARYNFDGTLPPMGMGKNAAAGRSAILNKAAELKYGVDPDQQRRDQLTNKGEVAAQNSAVKSFSDGKLGSTVRSFNVSIAHLNTLDQLSDALGSKDTPVINRIANAYAKQTGQAAPVSFEAAKKIVADEVVKAIVGSGGALADREEAAKQIMAASSPAQLKGVISTYKELMRGQLAGLRQQYETSTGRKDFDRFLSPEAKGGHGAPKSSVKDVKELPKTKPAASGATFLGFE